MLCPLKFSHYEFEGGRECIGEECGMHKLCGANDALAAENDVSEASMDANDVNAMQDSREKLEADIRKYRNEHCETSGRVAEWLDRQAAITEAEQREWWGGVVAELQAKVDELTEQRDRWRSNWTERNVAYSELADEYQELEAKVDELTAELTAARKAHAQAEHEAVILREKLGRMLDCSHEITRIGGDVTP